MPVSVPFTSGSSLQLVKVKGHVIRTGVSVPFTSGSSLQRGPLHRWRPGFQVSVPFTSGSSLQHDCKALYTCSHYVSVPFTSGSSLQPIDAPYDAEATICFSSLYIGILAATCEDRQVEPAIIEVSVPFTSGSSLQQRRDDGMLRAIRVSVPFTSGSSLQLTKHTCYLIGLPCFSSLYIGILAATPLG